jgi:hypothetical protein
MAAVLAAPPTADRCVVDDLVQALHSLARVESWLAWLAQEERLRSSTGDAPRPDTDEV